MFDICFGSSTNIMFETFSLLRVGSWKRTCDPTYVKLAPLLANTLTPGRTRRGESIPHGPGCQVLDSRAVFEFRSNCPLRYPPAPGTNYVCFLITPAGPPRNSLHNHVRMQWTCNWYWNRRSRNEGHLSQ